MCKKREVKNGAMITSCARKEKRKMVHLFRFACCLTMVPTEFVISLDDE
jgi:hypothetical protein